VPSDDEIETLADAMADDHEVAIWLGALAGLRAGEVAGLRVDAVEFLRRQVRVDWHRTPAITASVHAHIWNDQGDDVRAVARRPERRSAIARAPQTRPKAV
jgi:integrase